MAAQPKQVSFKLDGGMDDVSVTDDVTVLGQPSPNLATSINTRLSKTPGVPKKCPGATSLATVRSGPCGGFVPHGKLDSTVAFFRRTINDGSGNNGPANRVISEGQILTLGMAYDTVQPPAYMQNDYYPADVTEAGVVPGGTVDVTPSIAVLDGNAWYASIRTNPSTGFSGVFLSIMTGNQILVPPTMIVSLAAVGQDVFVGLTAHGADGMRLWYARSNTVYIRTLTLASGVVTVSSETAVYVSASLARGRVAVTTTGSSRAFLACPSTASVNDIATIDFDVAMNAIQATIVRAFGVGLPVQTVDVGALLQGSTYQVVVAVCNDSGTGTRVFYHSGTGAIAFVGDYAPTASYGEPAVSFIYSSSLAAYVQVVSVSIFAGTWPTTASQVFVDVRTLAGVFRVSSVIPWTRLVTKAVTWNETDDAGDPRACTFLVTQTNYQSATANTPSSVNFLEDPSVDVLMLTHEVLTLRVTRVARLGVGTAVRGTGLFGRVQSRDFTNINSQTAIMDGSTLRLSYLSDGLSVDGGQARYAAVSFASRQPRYAFDAKGNAIIAAACPAYWDGAEVAEYSPCTVPKISAAAGGLGPNLTGDYGFIAVCTWRDATTGQLRRSAPSLPFRFTYAANKALITVSVPVAMRDGTRLESFAFEIYASVTSGATSYYRQVPNSAPTKTSTTWTYDNIPVPIADAAHPVLYSDGSPTQAAVPYCPPALHDIAVVGNRGWAILSERRGVAICTKEPTSEFENEGGVAFEFSADAAFEVRLPAAAGALTAVADGGGAPIFLSPTGIWTVDGSGPDNIGQGSAFGVPRQVSDVACTTRESVIKTPIGVMFESNGSFCVYAGQVKSWNTVAAGRYGAIKSSFLFRKYDEVVFVGESGWWVYNYAVDRWTAWELSSIVGATTPLAVAVPASGDVLAFGANLGIYLIQQEAVSTGDSILLSTGDMSFGGPQGDLCVTEAVIESLYEYPHSLTVTAYADHSTTGVARTFDAATITAAKAYGRYTVSVRLTQPVTRCLKLEFYEQGSGDQRGDGFNPISVTLLYGETPGTQRRAVKPSMRK